MSAVVVPFPILNAGDTEVPRCSDYDPDWWFEEMSFDKAVDVCRRCPVRTKCLNQALEAGETVGVWGGLTPAQRASLPTATVVSIWSGARRR